MLNLLRNLTISDKINIDIIFLYNAIITIQIQKSLLVCLRADFFVLNNRQNDLLWLYMQWNLLTYLS